MNPLLNTTLVHEHYRCIIAFELFNFSKITLKPESLKRERINCYNQYVDFLSHLYEFYIGLIDNKLKPEKNKKHELYNPNLELEKYEIIDNIFNFEMEKLMRNRKNRILNGLGDDLGHPIEFYDCKVPKEFGQHFRIIRNRRNHTDYRRASNDFDISLMDFYKLYHKFIYILYHESNWLWTVDVEKYEWKAIDDFALEIIK